jgi:hypothetical protein
MRRRKPDEKQVAAEAQRLAAAMGEWAARAEGSPPDKARVAALLAALARDEAGLASAAARANREPATWEGATQLYLGLAALHHGLSDLGDRRPQRKKALEGLRRELERAFPDGRENTYDSPSRFDPAALEKQLGAVSKWLK